MTIDVFDVNRTLAQACEREPNVTPQRDGSLLVEVTSQEVLYLLCQTLMCPALVMPH